MTKLLAACSATAAALLLAPSPAGAATLSTSGPNPTYDAAPGETNTLTIERVGGVYRFTDAPGITVTPSGGLCTAVANVGECPATDVNDVRAFTDDMNDSINATASIPLEVGFVFIGGGDGNDTLVSNAPGDTQMNGDDDFGTPGNDILAGGAGEQTMIGGPGNDVMSAGDGEDRLILQDGNDALNGGDGDDLFDGGSEADGPDLMFGGAGRDRVDMRTRTDDLYVNVNGVADDGAGCPGAACEGDNVLPDVEDVSTGLGNDTLIGRPEADRLNTEDGNDVMRGLGGGDSLQSSNGDDQLFGGGGEDQFFGGEGADSFFGGPGDDQLFSEFFDESSDRFSGGGGFDSVTGLEGDSQPVTVSLNGQPDDGFRASFVTTAKDNVLPDIEDFEGSEGADILIGSRRPNEITGFGGRDRIVGGGGGDGLIGGRGADLLTGGMGIDFFDGGGGPDRLRSRDRRPDELHCGSSIDRVKADRSDDFGPDCDKVSLPRRRR